MSKYLSPEAIHELLRAHLKSMVVEYEMLCKATWAIQLRTNSGCCMRVPSADQMALYAYHAFIENLLLHYNDDASQYTRVTMVNIKSKHMALWDGCDRNGNRALSLLRAGEIRLSEYIDMLLVGFDTLALSNHLRSLARGLGKRVVHDAAKFIIDMLNLDNSDPQHQSLISTASGTTIPLTMRREGVLFNTIDLAEVLKLAEFFYHAESGAAFSGVSAALYDLNRRLLEQSDDAPYQIGMDLEIAGKCVARLGDGTVRFTIPRDTASALMEFLNSECPKATLSSLAPA